MARLGGAIRLPAGALPRTLGVALPFTAPRRRQSARNRANLVA